MKEIALVVGASGIAGIALARKLISCGWTTYGLSRNPLNELEDLLPIAADLLDKEGLESALKEIRPTHIFITTWIRKNTEQENIEFNKIAIRNLLDVLSFANSVKHIALVTGLKHYLGPFDAYGKDGFTPITPLREEFPRRNIENFYYAQEDEIYAAAKGADFSWSIHRPHTIIGKAVGNMMNLGTTLAVYATICKETGRNFQWPGSEAQWKGLSDMTDAKVLAEHLIWASTNKDAKNEAFNVVNGDVFRWSWLWPKLAEWFGIESIGWNGTQQSMEVLMANDVLIWEQIAEKYNLKEKNISRVASPWHTDLDLGKPIEVITDMSKSRKLGFNTYQQTLESFFDLFTQLRNDKIIV